MSRSAAAGVDRIFLVQRQYLSYWDPGCQLCYQRGLGRLSRREQAGYSVR